MLVSHEQTLRPCLARLSSTTMSSSGLFVPAARPGLSHAMDQNTMLPVTPQRISRVQKQIRAVSSPLTPSNFTFFSSPFTPVTNTYSSPSSVDTPNSSVSSGTKVDISPVILKFKNASVADVADNWRERAGEHGIKVSASMEAEGSIYVSTGTFMSSEWQSLECAGTTGSCMRTTTVARNHLIVQQSRSRCLFCPPTGDLVKHSSSRKHLISLHSRRPWPHESV